jgi:hypothetical protein
VQTIAPLFHEPNPRLADHLETARKLLVLPIAASGLHWHPFGLFTIPMAKRSLEDMRWSRRLHLWHPEAIPVGEASPYGVHTHSGDAASHVLVGALEHHLHQFVPDADGAWTEQPTDGGRRASRTAHVQASTVSGMTHRLPADQPHGVSKNGAWAISLFEQKDARGTLPFTTWQRNDVPAEELVRTPPIPLDRARREALMLLERALYETANPA